MRCIIAILVFVLSVDSIVYAGGPEIVSAARSQLGVPYSWGGGHGRTPGKTSGTCVGYTGPKPCRAPETIGFDCSGLSRYAVWKGLGFDIGSGNTDSQLNSRHSTVISRAGLQPGDLILYGPRGNTHHVAVYSGNNRMIEAPHTNANVREVPLRPGDFYVHIH
ncbi:hypothetical protein BGZ83_001747 [Gryganskiella cystojenkinii]|nr:hypothetical protein BGZ83_001747 [Gryganskiella cystojenkinii]